MSKLKSMLVVLAAFCMMSIPALGLVGVVSAEDLNLNRQVNCGVEFQGNPPPEGCDVTDPGALNNVIIRIINIFSWIVGAVCVIMIIYGGFRYVTSAGNDANVTSAKNTILYAIIGLVIVALAQVIVRFVMNQFGSNT